MYNLSIFLLSICIHYSYAATYIPFNDARWCTHSDSEMKKCEDLVEAIFVLGEIDEIKKEAYASLPNLICIQASDRFSCMKMINDDDADLMALDPGMGYTAGQFYTMMPLMAEKYEAEDEENSLIFLAVAVVKKTTPDININALEKTKACYPGVGYAAGWTYPISTLIEKNIMPVTECNVPVKSAAAFFGKMCAPNGLARFYNPFGNNPTTICENCKGESDEWCSGKDPYAGYSGAFDCVTSGNGDVAFIRHSTIIEMTTNSSLSVDDYELLCLDGTRSSPDNAVNCNWGKVSSHVVMTTVVHEEKQREGFKKLMQLLDSDFGLNGNHKDMFELYSSANYDERDLMFSDATQGLVDVNTIDKGNRNSYYSWAGEEYARRVKILNNCPLKQARWCVVSQHEMEKCENMIMAFAAKALKPDLNCIYGESIRDCMYKIGTGDADLVTLDAADVFIAGKYYDLVPIASEDYSGYDEEKYYAVAVARKTDSRLTIFNMKARRSCHPAVMTAAGWVVPVNKLIETVQIQINDGDLYRSIGQLFSKSCVPGILDYSYNPYGTNPINMCEACASGGPDRCKRSSDELYYGNSGAFRCLTEKGGDIAFVKHTTVRENTNGNNRAEWSRNRRSDDYQLLCNDGTRKPIDAYADCNLGAIPANAIVTAAFKSVEDRKIFWTLLNFAQQFFASDESEDFPMFDSTLNYKDLLFQDSTVRLVYVSDSKQTYQKYLGETFIRSMERLEGYDKVTSVSSPLTISYIPLMFYIFICILHLMRT